MKKNRDLIFLVFLIIILSFGIFTLIRTPKEVSTIENRGLSRFNVFLLKDFINGDFQKNIESAFSDQFIGSETIKKNMKKIENIFNPLTTIPKKYCKGEYFSIGSGFSTYNCGDYLVNPYQELDLKSYDPINNRIKSYNKLSENYDMYYYIINRSFNINFKTGEYSINLYDYLKENLKNYKGISQLEIPSYEVYKNYFYKTDHHWNNRGSYQGYKDIMKMFDIEKIIKPIDEITFNDAIFYGSTAKKLSYWGIKEKFRVYKFNFEDHDEYISGVEGTYGNYQKYFDGHYSNSFGAGYYGDFYGGDNSVVKYDFHNKNRNLLILSSSFSNPINTLIASHFNETHVIDMRHYKDIDINAYALANEIDCILIIADLNYFTDSSFDLEGV